MNIPTLKLPTLRPDQSIIVQDPAATKVCICGRAYGKTVLAGVTAVSAAFAGASVAWCVPTYRNGAKVWREIIRPAVVPLTRLGVRLNNSELLVEFPNGGWLQVYSTDKGGDALRGAGLDLAILDEARDIPADFWTDVVLGCLAHKDGQAIIISSPSAAGHWLQVLYEQARHTEGMAAWRLPSWVNPSPAVQKFVDRARQTMPEIKFRQEFGAEFMTGSNVFQHVREQATATPQNAPIKDHEYHAGIDWGRSGDATVMAVYDVNLKAIVHIMRMVNTPFETQLNRIKDLATRFEVRTMLVEKNSLGSPLYERLKGDKLPVQPWTMTLTSKNELIDKLIMSYQFQTIATIPDETLIGEMMAFSGKQLANGLYSYSAPSGMHDDIVVAVALAHFSGGTRRTGTVRRYADFGDHHPKRKAKRR